MMLPREQSMDCLVLVPWLLSECAACLSDRALCVVGSLRCVCGTRVGDGLALARAQAQRGWYSHLCLIGLSLGMAAAGCGWS